jgi:hypothetical protein
MYLNMLTVEVAVPLQRHDGSINSLMASMSTRKTRLPAVSSVDIAWLQASKHNNRIGQFATSSLSDRPR